MLHDYKIFGLKHLHRTGKKSIYLYLHMIAQHGKIQKGIGVYGHGIRMTLGGASSGASSAGSVVQRVAGIGDGVGQIGMVWLIGNHVGAVLSKSNRHPAFRLHHLLPWLIDPHRSTGKFLGLGSLLCEPVHPISIFVQLGPLRFCFHQVHLAINLTQHWPTIR